MDLKDQNQSSVGIENEKEIQVICMPTILILVIRQ